MMENPKKINKLRGTIDQVDLKKLDKTEVS
jgi:hypothetical protein